MIRTQFDYCKTILLVDIISFFAILYALAAVLSGLMWLLIVKSISTALCQNLDFIFLTVRKAEKLI